MKVIGYDPFIAAENIARFLAAQVDLQVLDVARAPGEVAPVDADDRAVRFAMQPAREQAAQPRPPEELRPPEDRLWRNEWKSVRSPRNVPVPTTPYHLRPHSTHWNSVCMHSTSWLCRASHL